MCRHNAPLVVNVECLTCVREKIHIGKLVSAHLKDVLHNLEGDYTLAYLLEIINTSLRTLYLPYGFTAKAIRVENDIRVLHIPPTTKPKE